MWGLETIAVHFPQCTRASRVAAAWTVERKQTVLNGESDDATHLLHVVASVFTASV